MLKLWESCETSFRERCEFLERFFIRDPLGAGNSHAEIAMPSIEEALTTQINRLTKLLNTLSKEMALVSRRESIKARLAEIERELDPSQVLHGKHKKMASEKLYLNNEFKLLTKQVSAALIKWEKNYQQEFVFRGERYLDVIDCDRISSERSAKSSIANDIQKWVKRVS